MLQGPCNSCPLVGASSPYAKSPLQSTAKAFMLPTASLKSTQRLWRSFEGSKRGQYHQQEQQRLLVLCNGSQDQLNGLSGHEDYLEAYVVDAELVKHQQLRRRGFSGGSGIWHSSDPLVVPLNEHSSDPISSDEHGLLSRFRNPTIFLRIACDGNLLLPIIVGEFAIGRLIDASHEDEKGGRPNQFQLMRDLVRTLGHEVRMVRITERVVNTYYARIYFGKPGDKAMLSVDARPSDAINLAKRCKVPIYVNKAIIATDAIKLVYGTPQTLGKWKANNAKSGYDLSLDSAVNGPDPIAEELNLVRNMLIAVVEERYRDAALWRDELNKLRISKHNQGMGMLIHDRCPILYLCKFRTYRRYQIQGEDPRE